MQTSPALEEHFPWRRQDMFKVLKGNNGRPPNQGSYTWSHSLSVMQGQLNFPWNWKSWRWLWLVGPFDQNKAKQSPCGKAARHETETKEWASGRVPQSLLSRSKETHMEWDGTTLKLHLTPVKMATIKKIEQRAWWGCRERGHLHPLLLAGV